MNRPLAIALLGAALAACASDAAPSDGSVDPAWSWDIPEHFPTPRVPDDNPVTEASAELGRLLFYDTRLSENQTQSCASCHLQELAFTDGLGQAVGSTGEVHPRSAMSLANVAYAPRLNWANNIVDHLEVQALGPLFGETPVELGMGGREDLLLERLRADDELVARFVAAYPDAAEPVTLDTITRALASFQRTLISGDSPYDRYVHGDADAMSDAAVRGMDLFFSERLECFHCHGGALFTDAQDHLGLPVAEVAFHNTGLYNVDGRGAYPADNRGLYDVTGHPDDMGRFRAPTLRNIAVTAPYFHDGSALTLGDVVDHYSRGGRLIEDGPNAGDGRESPLKSEFVQGFLLSDAERNDLIAFLEALTDETFLTNPRFSDPHVGDAP